MNTILNVIIGIFYLASMISISFLWLREKQKVSELAMFASQLVIDRDLLIQKVDQQDKEISALQSEDFIGFLTKSREFAFDYIEKTQSAIIEFKNTIDPMISYHNKYGKVLGETLDWQKMEEVSVAYARLLDVLPKENEIPNN